MNRDRLNVAAVAFPAVAGTVGLKITALGNIGVIPPGDFVQGGKHALIGPVIAVHKCEIFSGGDFFSFDSGFGRASVGLVQKDDVGVVCGIRAADCRARIGGTVIDENDLQWRKRLVHQRIETPGQIFRAIVDGDNDAYFYGFSHFSGCRKVRVCNKKSDAAALVTIFLDQHGCELFLPRNEWIPPESGFSDGLFCQISAFGGDVSPNQSG